MNEIVRDERVIALEINAIKQQARAMLVSSAVEIGRRLTEAKAMVPYGSWGAWLRENVDYSERTAQNLMRCWEEYGKKEKAQALADVSLTNAVALLGATPEQRTELIESGEAAALSTRELEQRIAEMREESEARQMRIDELLEQAEEARRREEDAEKARASAMEAQAEAMKALDERDGLQSRIEALESQNADRADEIRNLQEKAKADREHARLAEKRAKEAEKRAEEAEAREPERIEVEKRIEVVPEAVSEELERLRAIAAKAPDESVIRLRDSYARALKEFETVKGVLDGMDAAGSAEAARYRAAMAAGLRKMAGQIGGESA